VAASDRLPRLQYVVRFRKKTAKTALMVVLENYIYYILTDLLLIRDHNHHVYTKLLDH